MKTVRIAAAQTAEFRQDIEAALNCATDVAARAEAAGAALLCFPEGFLQGYLTDETLARRRYQAFKEQTWDALQSLEEIFHYHFVNAQGPVETVEQNILRELKYQSTLELDPRTVDRERLVTLAALGFNRLSFGVQDFDPDVQKAVHRIQPAEQVFDLMAIARGLGFAQRLSRPSAQNASRPT